MKGAFLLFIFSWSVVRSVKHSPSLKNRVNFFFFILLNRANSLGSCLFALDIHVAVLGDAFSSFNLLENEVGVFLVHPLSKIVKYIHVDEEGLLLGQINYLHYEVKVRTDRPAVKQEECFSYVTLNSIVHVLSFVVHFV